MIKAVLKTLAISFGGGLALGAGIRLTQGAAKTRKESAVDLDPLLNRLKDVESRIVQMESSEGAEHTSATAPGAVTLETLAAFESRLATQFAGADQLRSQIRQVDQRLVEIDAQIPVIVQSTVDVRFGEVERKLKQDFEEAQNRSMEAFVATLQNKVVDRISTLETNLAEQSQSIGKLRDVSLKTDESLQKMLAGIEKLVGQNRAAPPSGGATVPPAPPDNGRVRMEPAVEPVVAQVSEAPQAKPEPVTELALAVVQPRAVTSPQIDLPVRQESEPALVSESTVATAVATSSPAPARVTPIRPAPEPAHVNGATQESPPARHVNGATTGPALAVAEEPPSAPAASEDPHKPEESYEWVNRIGLELLAPVPKSTPNWRGPVAVGLVAGLIIVAGLFYSGILQRFLDHSVPEPATPSLASTAPTSEPVSLPANPIPAVNPSDLQSLEQRVTGKPGDPASLVELAREYARRKNWAKAEATYRSALENGPGNREAALGLSDVLYQEQKYEESAAVLNKLSAMKSQ